MFLFFSCTHVQNSFCKKVFNRTHVNFLGGFFDKIDFVDILRRKGYLVAIFIPLNKIKKKSPPFIVSIKEIETLFSKKFNLLKKKLS